MTTTNKCLECSYLGDDVYEFCDKHQSLHCPLCDTSLDQHEANSCMNAWVAVVVFGWKWYRLSDNGHRAIFPKETPDWFSDLADGTEPLARDWDCRLPEYSTDIHDADRIIGHMISDEYEFILNTLVHHQGFACAFWRESLVAGDLQDTELPEPDDYAQASTRPLAICRAAIKAKS